MNKPSQTWKAAERLNNKILNPIPIHMRNPTFEGAAELYAQKVASYALDTKNGECIEMVVVVSNGQHVKEFFVKPKLHFYAQEMELESQFSVTLLECES